MTMARRNSPAGARSMLANDSDDAFDGLATHLAALAVAAAVDPALLAFVPSSGFSAGAPLAHVHAPPLLVGTDDMSFHMSDVDFGALEASAGAFAMPFVPPHVAAQIAAANSTATTLISFVSDNSVSASS